MTVITGLPTLMGCSQLCIWIQVQPTGSLIPKSSKWVSLRTVVSISPQYRNPVQSECCLATDKREGIVPTEHQCHYEGVLCGVIWITVSTHAMLLIWASTNPSNNLQQHAGEIPALQRHHGSWKQASTASTYQWTSQEPDFPQRMCNYY